MISFAAKSTSLTRNRNASNSRMPVPYNTAPTSQHTPGNRSSTARTSSRVNTTGIRAGRLARTSAVSQPTGDRNTSPYRNTSAESA